MVKLEKLEIVVDWKHALHLICSAFDLLAFDLLEKSQAKIGEAWGGAW